MRIRRRDRGEPTPPPPAVEPVEPPSQATDDLRLDVVPPMRPVDHDPVAVLPVDPSPPPFDQALLQSASLPDIAEAPPVAPASPPPAPPAFEAFTPIEPTPPAPVVEPPAAYEAPEPVYQAPEPAYEAAEPAYEAPVVVTVTESYAVVEEVVVTPVDLPVEPKHAKEPIPPRAAAPAVPQMRTPSIRAEADSLLDGARPAPRELPRVIAIANQKGGVGKTTTTVNLGAALAEMGYRVLVIDLDPQGNATTGLGIDARNFELSMYDVIMRDQSLEDCIEPTSVKNLFVAPATIDLAGIEIELVPAFSREMKLKRAIDTVVDDFDFILIDCPPSLGLITVNGLAAAGEVMVPIQCEYYALEGLSQLLRNVNLVSSNLNETLEVTTIVLTMFDARTRLSIDVANEVRLHFADRVCKSVIPRTVRLSEAPSFGQPITVFDPTSRGAVAYRELAQEVSNGAPQRTR
jgi:chromosome partitioning protein